MRNGCQVEQRFKRTVLWESNSDLVRDTDHSWRHPRDVFGHGKLAPCGHRSREGHIAAVSCDLDAVVEEFGIALKGERDTRRDIGCRGSWLLDGDLVVKALHSPDPRGILLGCVFLV